VTENAGLVGRERERYRLDGLLDEVRAGTPVLALVEGPPGSGRTSLVDDFIERHPTMRVHTASGAEWERHHPWGVLEQLTGAVTGSGDAIDTAHAYLETVREPTLVVVDHAHLSDVDSLQTLSSMIRRAHDRPVLMLWIVPDVLPASVDDDVARVLAVHRGTTVHVGPLTPESVARLVLVHTGIDLSPWTAHRLHDHTLGNPGAVQQLLDEIPHAQWHRWRERFPAPQQVASTVQRTLASCAPATRDLVRAAAILGDGAHLTVVAALTPTEDPIPLLDEAFSTGLLTVSEERGVTTVSFADPMTRAAVTDGIGPAARHDLHARAAELVDDEGRSLFHLVSATPTSDGALADRLDDYARERASDGEWRRAAEALITAGRITPDRDLRTQRLIRGVDALIGAADLPQAQTFVPEIESVPGGPMRNTVLAYLAIQRGRAAEAHHLLTAAWELGGDPPSDPGLAAMICQRMVLHSLARLRGDELVDWADRAASLVAENTPAAVEAAAIRGLGLGMTGHIEEAREAYATLPEHTRLGAQSQRIRMAEGWLALVLDEPDRARTELEIAEPTSFRGGSLRISLWAQAWLARTQFVLGAWDDALRTVDRAAAQLDSTGLDLLRPLVHWTGAQIHALRGDWAASREHILRGRAGVNDYALMLVPSCISAAQCAEVAADYDSVLRYLEPLRTLQHRAALDEPGFWPWTDLYGNALVMTGRVDEADAFLTPHEERAVARGHRSAKARLGYVRGRIHGARGDIDAAQESFESALAELTPLPLPYARARVNFAYGQTLRRAGRRRDADSVIRTARELYSTLGATSITARCDRELKAGGLKGGASATGRESADVSALTPQERAVATLVAGGNTNKEVASELFLSVKTVQYHLTRVYAKFGIRSRSELAARFRQEQ